MKVQGTRGGAYLNDRQSNRSATESLRLCSSVFSMLHGLPNLDIRPDWYFEQKTTISRGSAVSPGLPGVAPAIRLGAALMIGARGEV